MERDDGEQLAERGELCSSPKGRLVDKLRIAKPTIDSVANFLISLIALGALFLNDTP